MECGGLRGKLSSKLILKNVNETIGRTLRMIMITQKYIMYKGKRHKTDKILTGTDNGLVRAFKKGEDHSSTEITASCELFTAAQFHQVERPKCSSKMPKNI